MEVDEEPTVSAAISGLPQIDLWLFETIFRGAWGQLSQGLAREPQVRESRRFRRFRCLRHRVGKRSTAPYGRSSAQVLQNKVQARAMGTLPSRVHAKKSFL